MQLLFDEVSVVLTGFSSCLSSCTSFDWFSKLPSVVTYKINKSCTCTVLIYIYI